MGSEDYIEYGGYMAFIATHGRCAITGEPFTNEDPMAVVPLPVSNGWGFPCHGDYPLGANAKALAFVRRSTLNSAGVPLGRITEAIECKDGAIIYHPVNYQIAEADETTNPTED